MKLGVLSASLASKPVEEMLSYLSDLGVEAVELGTGGYTNDAHTKPEELLADKAKLAEYKKLFPKYNIEISALSVHGNAVSPDKDFAKLSHEKFETTCKLANELGVETVITFSGCPGGSPEDKMPNWVTCPWPEDFLKVLDYQWNDVLIPYWQKTSEIAKSYGINKIAFEMHPGFCVYNPETMLKIRAAVGECLGAQLPSRSSAQRARSSTSTQRIPRSTSTTQLSTVCLTASTTATSSTARGYSAASATATTTRCGRKWFPCSSSLATTT